MKAALILLLTLLSTEALAAAKGQDFNDTTGIITYQVATGMIRVSRFTQSEAGEIVVCQDKYTYNREKETCQDAKTNNMWQYMHGAIPKGKTFVGWKSVSSGYGFQAIEIYWK